MKRVLATLACLLFLAAPVYAQKTKAVLTTEVNTNWPDNTVGAITPALLRSTVIDIINSYFDFGGASSFSCPTNQWITQLASLADNVICAQPSFTQLSNYLGNEVSNLDLALVPAWTIKGNPTSGSATPADFTIASLTQKVTPTNADLLLLSDSAAANALKKVTWGSLPGATGNVASLNTLTGTLSVASGNSNCAIAASSSAQTVTISCESVSTIIMGTGGANLSVSATQFFTTYNSATEVGFMVAPVAGLIKNFYVQISSAPGTGKNYSFSLRVAGALTAVGCTISGVSATSCSDTSNTAAVAIGNGVDVQSVPGGSPNPAAPTVTMQFQTP